MKHLYSFYSIVLFLFFINTSWGQNVIAINASSIGTCDGAAYLENPSLYPPGIWTFSWYQSSTQIAANDSLITNLCPGSYTIVGDSAGTVVYTQTFSINYGCLITAFAQELSPDNGTCNGALTVNVYGGTPPYIFDWSNGATTQSISNLCGSTWMYYATVTDAMGCMIATNGFVVSNPAIAINLSFANDTSNNCTGVASCSPSGGTAPYTILWSTGDTTSSIIGLCAGTYSVTAQDANQITTSSSFTITNPCTSFTGSFTSTGTINGNCIGTSTFNVSGGLQPYEYSLDNGATFTPDNTIFGLCPGTYDFICMDANGCLFSQPVTISDSTVIINISANLTSTDDLTNNCSGSASVSPSGGIAPYTVSWSNGQSGNVLSYLCAGIYSVTVWDATDSTTVSFVIADSSSTYSNNPYPNATINDTLYTDLVTNCVIDYNTIDSASLYQAVYNSSAQSMYVTWAVYSPTDTVYISDTLAFFGNPGYYNLTITIYCPNKSGNDFFKIEQVVFFNGFTFVWKPTLGLDEQDLLDQVSVYPNPFNSSISVDNTNGVIQSVKLIDLNGRVISEMSSLNSGLVEMTQLESVSNGTYLLILSGENISKTYKVIK